MVKAERKAREHRSQGAGCDGWLSAPPVPPHFLGSPPPPEARSLWKSATRVPGRKTLTLIQNLLDTHKLSNGAREENMNVGQAIKG